MVEASFLTSRRSRGSHESCVYGRSGRLVHADFRGRAPLSLALDANADQIAFWNGLAGERWAREQEALDRALAPFTASVLDCARLRPGDRVLDIGCGCGATTLAAAEVVGATGSIVGIDVSAPMLARARERSAGRANVSYVSADASSHRFEAMFDAEISRFGVMFFRDPAATFASLRAALRPGGRLAFACWRPVADNEWLRVPYDAATQHVAPDPPQGPDDPGPFSFGDPARVQRILAGAGYTSVNIVPFYAPVVFSHEGIEEAAHFAMTAGPTSRLLQDAPDEVRERVRSAIEVALRPYAERGRVALGGATWTVSAVA